MDKDFTRWMCTVLFGKSSCKCFILPHFAEIDEILNTFCHKSCFFAVGEQFPTYYTVFFSEDVHFQATRNFFFELGILYREIVHPAIKKSGWGHALGQPGGKLGHQQGIFSREFPAA